MPPAALRFPVDSTRSVSARLDAPSKPRALYVFAHGAGAGMDHDFMGDLARALAGQDVAVLRFQFPFIEAGSKRPDAAPLAQATVRAAVAFARERCPTVPCFAGGKSFGGRMASQAQAEAPLEGVRGLVFIGFPLHPAGKPSTARADHLSRVDVPMFFAQGTRDALAERRLLLPVVKSLGARATLLAIDEADHAFHVPKRSGRDDAAVIDEIAAAAATWMRATG